jgi:hypothetical protein
VKTKKLHLNRETLRHLNAVDLRGIAGGTGARDSCQNCSLLCSVGVVCGTTGGTGGDSQYTACCVPSSPAVGCGTNTAECYTQPGTGC